MTEAIIGVSGVAIVIEPSEQAHSQNFYWSKILISKNTLILQAKTKKKCKQHL